MHVPARERLPFGNLERTVSHWHQYSAHLNKADDSSTRKRLSRREADVVVFGVPRAISLATLYPWHQEGDGTTMC
jgi:hypothetical protein